MEENIPLQAIPYYWRNRLTILKKIADKKATPDGRKEFTEYQHNWAKQNAARKRYNRQFATAKNYSLTTGNNSTIVSSHSTGERVNSTAQEKKTIITEMPPGWKRPETDFVIPNSSWN